MGVIMTANYNGQLHCEAVHQPSGNTLDTDAPVDNQGRGLAFSPTELLGASLLTCAMTTLAIKAPSKGLNLEKMSGTVEKQMTPSAPRRVESLTVHLRINDPVDPKNRATEEDIARNCPVALSLHPDIKIPISFTYSD